MNMIEVERINSYYGDSHVLFDVSMDVRGQEVVALLGRNGAGKSTTLKTLAGVLHPRSGAIRFEGESIELLPTHRIASLGLQLVPEERRIFGGLTVEENLELAALSAAQRLPLADIFVMFPRLRERRSSYGRSLSGGEQQMLAIARALIRRPRLLLLDEPFEGLAVTIVQGLLEVCRELVAQGQTIVIVEQNVRAALSLARRAYVLDKGRIVFGGSAEELQASPDVMDRYLGV
ncbi:ABC transporter ATP-binding protein [Bradyrhizobium sp. ISRA443]|uniref:ABC transporter ATP-binding protein n=1 Tax=unclassified Bradyrhizobium TaxID=2631580 RepID=UPI002479382C|nr:MULTISPECIES: ABC transporter ATP-binding protein [unclassified Bradyrhizobium]WGR91554.1 ABC transporter ATP-binding protein [Bradyrhizobium sp. ISRA435]WGS01849.1 ABC transporter ATP-binding protein [Bradyrhizobium sp. ISRA436]WGS08735.1 ABC transporter ATP-binding protein [Bradyrhizobium sp. ISRA437]WGS15623.1 ABC transporter ATP-binding protein [Bradyrhizobium sp. ISRA443]